MSAAPLSEPSQDGRRARRDRSRDVAVDVLLELLDEGIDRPTAQQVAERSGVSLRSIFRIFDDVDSLHLAAATRQLERVRHLYAEVPARGTLEERAETTVRFLHELYGEVANVRRAALRGANRSGVMRDQLHRGREWVTGEIQRVFADEVAGADPALLAAVEVALSFEVWDHLEARQGLDGDQRVAATLCLLLGVLGPRRQR